MSWSAVAPILSTGGFLGSRTAPAGFERRSQRSGIVVAQQAATFDEEGRGRVSSAGIGTREIAIDPFCDCVAVHVFHETVNVQTEFLGIAYEVRPLECVLVCEDQVQPSPELTALPVSECATNVRLGPSCSGERSALGVMTLSPLSKPHRENAIEHACPSTSGSTPSASARSSMPPSQERRQRSALRPGFRMVAQSRRRAMIGPDPRSLEIVRKHGTVGTVFRDELSTSRHGH